MEINKIKELVSKMTLEEKAGMCSGADFWHTKAVERLGIPAIMMSDGPFGLRKQEQEGDHLGLNDSIKAVCFPAGVATASSFDRNLVKELGETLGEECQAEDVAVLLGPAMNIKRSPLCGRNFEYYSEDPMVSSEMATAYIKGLQSKNIGASPKHFYANNMEERRMTSSSEVDERTAREIYLASFEMAVKDAKPWTVMCSYNKINGIYAAENKEALTDILRDEWGFDGFVVSDWGAANDRVPDLKAGMELEMPSSRGLNDKRIVAAVTNGDIEETVLDQACERILTIIYRYTENHRIDVKLDLEKDHEMARKVATECMVLLKNEGLLPLNEDIKIAFVGKYAKKPRFQGGGSSHINSFKVESILDATVDMKNIVFAEGFDDKSDDTDETMLQEAADAAKNAEIAVLFVGLPDLYESEGYDRKHMKLPPNQNRLIEEVCKVQQKVVIVLHNGSSVEMPWIEKVGAVLESYLSGQAVGGAQADILFGRVNPSAKLAETFPVKLQDNPSYLNFRLVHNKVHYTEGVFVGYRYYDSKEMEVLFPFGHGLSYTEFEYSNLKLERSEIKDTDTLKVTVQVKNTGSMAGKEVVQLYITPADCDVARPAKELKGFEKIELEPGETKTVTFELNKRSFAYWNTNLHDWYATTGNYGILVGASSRDIRLETTVHMESTTKIKVVYTKDSTIGDIYANPDKIHILQKMFAPMMAGRKEEQKNQSEVASEAITAEAQQAMMMSMPLRSLASFAGIDETTINQILAVLNQ
jgi:beta-glucosidase